MQLVIYNPIRNIIFFFFLSSEWNYKSFFNKKCCHFCCKSTTKWNNDERIWRVLSNSTSGWSVLDKGGNGTAVGLRIRTLNVCWDDSFWNNYDHIFSDNRTFEWLYSRHVLQTQWSLNVLIESHTNSINYKYIFKRFFFFF